MLGLSVLALHRVALLDQSEDPAEAELREAGSRLRSQPQEEEESLTRERLASMLRCDLLHAIPLDSGLWYRSA
jgi:hypothetical protein